MRLFICFGISIFYAEYELNPLRKLVKTWEEIKKRESDREFDSEKRIDLYRNPYVEVFIALLHRMLLPTYSKTIIHLMSETSIFKKFILC